MIDDLVERLRGKPPTHSTLDRYEAADALEAQAKRIEHLEMQLRLAVNSDSEYCKTVEAENAHLRICIAELEAALKLMIDTQDEWEKSVAKIVGKQPNIFNRAIDAARAALEKSDDN